MRPIDGARHVGDYLLGAMPPSPATAMPRLVACETSACDERRAPVASLGYAPHQAERTVLHQAVREHALRYRLAWDHALCRAVLAIYTRALLGFERRRARRWGIADGRSGTVTAIQRFGRGVQLNVHYHRLLMEGLFVTAPDGPTRFDPAPPPTDREVARLLATIRTRILPRVGRQNPFDNRSKGDRKLLTTAVCVDA